MYSSLTMAPRRSPSWIVFIIGTIALFFVVVMVFGRHRINDRVETGRRNDRVETTDYCVLNVSDPLIEYQCTTGKCNAKIYINDSVVYPRCIFFRHIKLSNMRCVNGQWNSTAVCPECGRVDANGSPTWHVNLYHNNQRVCGGSLISNRVILSAAHCFWHPTRQLLPASEFKAVADDNQTSSLSSIIVTDYFRDFDGSYQDDLAVVQLEKPFVYTLFVGPVCLDYTYQYPCQAMKTPSFGLTDTMKMINLTHVPIVQCFKKTRWDLRGFVTGDKKCAEDGSPLCLGDGGNGVVFKDYDNRYFLTGVVSRFFLKQNTCNMFSLTLYTNVYSHIRMISKVLLK